MIRNYDFRYNMFDGQAQFQVDTSKFTKRHAQEILDFFSWKYDKDADPINEAMKKIAMEAIIVATEKDCVAKGVVASFENKEGFLPLDEEHGIQLLYVEGYEFDEDELEMRVAENGKEVHYE